MVKEQMVSKELYTVLEQKYIFLLDRVARIGFNIQDFAIKEKDQIVKE